jgi:hypothetical protein
MVALLPGAAMANTGVPVLAGTVIGMIVALIPVVAVEALVLRDQLRMGALRALGITIVANIVSTLAGVIVAAIEVFLAPHFVIMVDSPNLLTLIALVPLFVLSVIIERPVVRKMSKQADGALVKRAVLLANVASYVLIAAFVIARMVKALLA